MASTNTEVLERLLIEVVGEDSTLRGFLDEAVKAAQKAAQEMRDALNLDFGRVAQDAKQAETAFEGMTTGIGDFGKVFDAQLKVGMRAFERFRTEGEMSEKEFNEYRQAVLDTIEVARPFAQTLGVTSETLDDLTKRIREATYEQKKNEEQTEDTQQEQEELAETIKRLSNEVRGSRNVWAGRIETDEQFRESTMKTRAELLELLKTVERGTTEHRKLSQELAYAQRGLDSVNKVASRGGLAWTAQIALANQFGQQLRNLGPAGGIAAGGLGLITSGFESLQAPLKFSDFGISKILGALARLPIVIPLASAALTLGFGVALTRITSQAAEYARQLDESAQSAGLTVEAYQEITFALKQMGVTQDQTRQGLNDFNARLGQAATGSKSIADAYKRLGVEIRDSNGRIRDGEEVFMDLIGALSQFDSAAAQAAVGGLVFGEEFSRRVIPALNAGREGIEALREEARALGLVISGDTVMSLADFGRELDTVKQQFEVLKVEVAAAFLPVMRDLFIPLLQDAVIPWLQNAVTAVDNFSDAFFDTTEAGEAFRRDTVQNLNAIIALGRGVVGAANAVAVAVNSIFSVTASIGSYIGNVTTLGMDSRTRQGLRESLEQLKELRDRAQALGDTAAVERFNDQIAATNALLGDMGSNWFTGIFRSGDDALRYAEGVLSSFDNMVGAFTFDVAAFVESAVSGVDRNRVRKALAPVGEGVGDAISDSLEKGTREALEGSLKHAQEQLTKAQEELGYAVGAEARAAALVVVEAWVEAVALIQAELEEFDPAKAAKVWTERLAAEVRFGLKDASEAFDLVNPRLEELREQAASALAEFGFDSTDYQDVVAKLEVLEAFIKSIKDDAASIDLSGLIASVGGGFALPDTGGDPTAGLVEGLQLIMRIEQAEAELEGKALDVGEAFSWMLPILEEQFDEVERGSALWFTIADLISKIRGDVDALDTSGLATLGGLALPDAGKTVGQALVEGFQQILRTEEALAGMRGVAADLNDEYVWMVDILDEHAATLEVGSQEWLQVVEAANQYRALITDLPDFGASGLALPDQTKTATQALRENHDWLLRVAAAQDILNGTQTDLTGTYLMLIEEQRYLISALQAGSEEWLQAVETLGRYEDALAGVLEGTSGAAGAFDAWAQAVGRLGVTLDPVDTALAELGTMFADGKITAEQYAVGIDLVSAAMDRLAASGDGGIDAITDAWEDAQAAIGEFLGRGPSQFDELREAAEAAFEAGVIGAEDLAAALQAIRIMEVVQGLRDLGSELGGTQGIIPNLAADLTKAAAQLAAGSTATGIATAFNAATAAVRGLGAAFEDTEHQAEAVLDLVIGSAAAVASVLGGPVLGQAVAAVGNFIKTILGDLSNGLAAIDKQISQTASSSKVLSEGLVRGIAEGATQTVSRGGLLGLLGFTKQALDDDAFRAGVSVAEGLANGLVNTLRSGDFEEAWQSFIDDIIINGIIEAFIATALVQDAIQEAMELIMGGDAAGGAAALDRLKSDFHAVWQTIQGITSTPLPSQDDLERSVTFSLPDATVSVLAAPQWALELTTAAERMSEAGSAMLTAADMMVDALSDGITVNNTSTRGIDAYRGAA